MLAYAVLESLDAPGWSFEECRGSHLPAGCEADDLVIRASDLDPLTADLRWMVERFPHGSVYRVLREVRAGRFDDAAWWIARAEREAGAVPPRFQGEGRRIDWLHLAELWAYLPEDAGA